jgi:transcriptional regulator with PAS, ATPase and Fis domain
VDFPFDLAAELVAAAPPEESLLRLAQGLPPPAPEFDAIIHRCAAMQRQVLLARRLAQHAVPVLIMGESGTGKELFARAIHHAGPRRAQPLVAVNCGAIPAELVEAELFGHVKGAFTGATRDRQGCLAAAHGGTLFLDEIGELPLPAQVKLLRVLQERRVRPLGADTDQPLDLRVIAATNRHLPAEVAAGRFREDLFHRLAVGILHLPPLRERPGDLLPLLEHLLGHLAGELGGDGRRKKLSAGAKNLLLQHPWPGNVRELWNTLLRASLWATGDTITTADVQQALLPVTPAGAPLETILHRPLGHGLSLPELLAEVARHYLQRAMAEAAGSKTKAAELVGLPSYQTLTNWLTKYQVHG